MRKETFATYYKQYLNAKEHETVVSSEQRMLPLNSRYYYHIIATQLGDRTVYSVHPKLYESFLTLKRHESIEKTLELFQIKHPTLTLRSFYRMSLGSDINDFINEARAYTQEDLENSIESLTEDEKKNHRKKQRPCIEAGNKFIVWKDNQIAASARITDIDFGGGNIAVYSSPEFRRLGYGKMVVQKCIDWCVKNDIVPIYLVDTNNTASVRLAKSLGLECYSKEYALSIRV